MCKNRNLFYDDKSNFYYIKLAAAENTDKRKKCNQL